MQPQTADQAWREIFTNPRHTGQTWACIGVAIAHADEVITQAARHAATPGDPRLRRNGPLWIKVAVSTYQRLADTGAYRHLALDLPGRLTIDQSAIRTWLTAPDPATGATVAEHLDIDDELLRDDEGRPARLANLLLHAQAAGVMRGHHLHVELWHLADNEGQPAGHRLGAQQDKAILASPHLDVTDLINERLTGVDAAIDFLTRTAQLAVKVLAAADPSVTPTPQEAPAWTRGFPAGQRQRTTTGPGTAAPAIPDPSDQPGRGATR